MNHQNHYKAHFQDSVNGQSFRFTMVYQASCFEACKVMAEKEFKGSKLLMIQRHNPFILGRTYEVLDAGLAGGCDVKVGDLITHEFDDYEGVSLGSYKVTFRGMKGKDDGWLVASVQDLEDGLIRLVD